MKQLRFSPKCLRTSLVLLSLPVHLGCSLIVDADRQQCSTDKDCENRGASFAGAVCIDSACQRDPKWACADNPETTVMQGAVQATFSLLSALDFLPVAGTVHATLCGVTDATCLKPVGQADSDASGTLVLGVPQGFNGYVIMQSDGFEPLLFFPRLPIKEGDAPQMAFLTPNTGAKQALAGQLGDVVDDTRGFVVVLLYDCQGKTAPGARVVLEGAMAGSHPYYSTDGIPTPTAEVTDNTGMFGILNAMPGPLSMVFMNGDKQIARTSLLVRSGYMTYRSVYVGDNYKFELVGP